MPKRKRQAADGRFPEFDALNLDQLLNERRSVGLQMQAIGSQYSEARRRHEYLTARIRSLRNGETGIGISDHAVLRYLERVKGFDVKAVREEIRARAALKGVSQVADQIVTDAADDVTFAIYDGDRIATVWIDDGNPPPHVRPRLRSIPTTPITGEGDER